MIRKKDTRHFSPLMIGSWILGGLVVLLAWVGVAYVDSSGNVPSQSTPISKAASTSAPEVKEKSRFTAKEQASLDETERIAMAQVIENTYLSKGMNVAVKAMGAHHSILQLKWIGVSKVTAYQIQHDDSFSFQPLRDAGFKRFTITDGFEESWSWNLR